MKTVLEFGIRGGYHRDNIVLPSIKLGAELAEGIARALGATTIRGPQYFCVSAREPRVTWQSDTHFVALSLLDGVSRGSAAARLWRKP